MIRSAVITGGASGIGKSYAKHLAAQGANILLIDIKQAEMVTLARQLSAEHGAKVKTLHTDLSEPANQIMVAQRISEIEGLDLLINSAGFGAPVVFHELDAEDHIDMLNVHVACTVRFCRAVLPGMLERKQGAIINVSSQTCYLFAAENAMYGSTKLFIDAFTKNLNEAYSALGIRMQILCPAYTKTEFHNSKFYGDEIAKRVPEFYWMDVDAVTSCSLGQLSLGKLVCVPGFWHKISYFFLKNGLVPGFVMRRFTI